MDDARSAAKMLGIKARTSELVSPKIPVKLIYVMMRVDVNVATVAMSCHVYDCTQPVYDCTQPAIVKNSKQYLKHNEFVWKYAQAVSVNVETGRHGQASNGMCKSKAGAQRPCIVAATLTDPPATDQLCAE